MNAIQIAKQVPSPATSPPLLDPLTLRIWLEWAGGKLLALPTPRIKPKKLRAWWPIEYNQDLHEVLEFRPGASFSLRSAAPNAQEITYMDRILTLPNLCGCYEYRWILHARSLVYPFTGRYIYPWQRIADTKGISRQTAISWHKKGLIEVCKKIPIEDVQYLSRPRLEESRP
jgi:hypothetical protein